MGLAKQMLELIDLKTTHLAPEIMYEPLSAYTSPEVLRSERGADLREWRAFPGSERQRARARLVALYGSGRHPAPALPRQTGRVRLYLNSCRHRGVKIVDGSAQAARLSCPFHAWTYDLDGRLVAVPEPEGFDQLCRADHGLIELPVAEKHGMIFGSPVPGAAIDVDDILGGMGPELGTWDFGSWSLYTEPHVHRIKGNWKVAWAHPL